MGALSALSALSGLSATSGGSGPAPVPSLAAPVTTKVQDETVEGANDGKISISAAPFPLGATSADLFETSFGPLTTVFNGDPYVWDGIAPGSYTFGFTVHGGGFDGQNSPTSDPPITINPGEPIPPPPPTPPPDVPTSFSQTSATDNGDGTWDVGTSWGDPDSGAPNGYEVSTDGAAYADIGLVNSHIYTSVTPPVTLYVRAYNAVDSGSAATLDFTG